MVGASASPMLWFERVYAYLRLPFWAGVLLFGVGLLVAVSLVLIVVSDIWDLVTLEVLGSIAVYGGMGLFAQWAAKNIRQRMERMGEHTKPMRGGTPLGLGPLYSSRNALITYVVLEVVIQPFYILYGIDPSLSVVKRILISVPFLFVDIFAFTFLWVLGFSFYTIYRVGRMELVLKSFTEDPSLGLNPLGRLALRLTGLYVVFLLFGLVPSLLSVILAPPIIVILVTLSLLSFAFFFLPLLPLRRRLLRTKRDLLVRLSPRLTRLYATISEDTQGQVRQDVVFELMALKAMQEDIRRIHHWPFDTGVVVRLSVIVFSVTAITLSRVIATFFGI